MLLLFLLLLNATNLLKFTQPLLFSNICNVTKRNVTQTPTTHVKLRDLEPELSEEVEVVVGVVQVFNARFK